MFAGGEVKQDFRLPLPEMSVMIVRRNRQIGERQLAFAVAMPQKSPVFTGKHRAFLQPCNDRQVSGAQGVQQRIRR